MIAELLQEDGFSLTKQTVKEWSSPCPACGGDDRFRIFIEDDRYWCRGCDASGDAIQYLRDFRSMEFKDAAEYAGKPIDRPAVPLRPVAKKKAQSKRCGVWQKRAADLVGYAHAHLMDSPGRLKWLAEERGISAASATFRKLGWIEHSFSCSASEFGLTGKDVYMPEGLTIPWKNSRVRFRRETPYNGKRYMLLTGSDPKDYMIFGDGYETTGIIVESELDAILLRQESSRPLFLVALGSVAMKPDAALVKQLLQCPMLMIALDSDAPGKAATGWWLDNFENAFPCPVPNGYGKDVTDLWKSGYGINEWLHIAHNYHAEEMM